MTKFCTNCGQEIENNIEKCPNCGFDGKNTTVDNTTNTQNTTNTSKSKVAAGLFGIFLGAFGVHNFYLKYTGKAIAQLLITVLSCGVLAGISSIWGLIEGILILTGTINVDANGNPLSE